MPGVAAASRRRSTSGSTGTPRVCTSRILRRPARSGGLTVTRRSNRPGPQQRRVEDLGAVGRGQHDHALVAGEAVHLGEDLVERLLPLVVAAERLRAAAGPADRVQLVDEDDRRRDLLGLVEQVTHPAGADADDHLDELRGRHREERHLGLAGHRAGQQRLAGAGRAGEQHAVRDLRAEPAVALRVAQEVDDLGDLLLDLLDAGHVGERGPRPGLRLVQLGPRPAEPADAAGPRPAAPRRRNQIEQADEQQGRAEADQQLLPERRRRVRRLGVDRYAVRLQLGEQVVVGEGRPLGGEPVDLLGVLARRPACTPPSW